MLPEYFNYYPLFTSPEQIEFFTIIENSFEKFMYENHLDDLTLLFPEQVDLTGQDLNNRVLEVYKEHINSVLTLQSIMLSDPYLTPIRVLSLFIAGTARLATENLEDILATIILLPDDSNEELYCKALAHMVNEDFTLFLPYVDTVDTVVKTTLLDKNNFDIKHNPNFLSSQIRFKQSTIDKVGPAIDLIRSFDRFGYDAHIAVKALIELLTQDMDITMMVDQIALLVLGSSTTDDMLLQATKELVEMVFHDANHVLMANTYIEKTNLLGVTIND